MAETTKKYYWLKLKEDFFKDKEIKKLRRIAGGDTYTIIYLKLMLLGLHDEGKLYFDGIEDSFAEELALEMDEDTDNVKMTLMYLLKVGLIQEIGESELFLTRLPECVGKETSKAELMRKKRARDKQEKIESGNNVTEVLPPVTNCYTEIDKDKELEQDIDTDIDKDEEEEEEEEKKKKKKERKKSSYDDVLSSLSDSELIDLYHEYIKMRNMIKAPMTDRALKMLMNKVFELEPTDIERQKKLLENAIVNNWKSVYPLKDEQKQFAKTSNNAGGNNNIFLEIAKEEGIF